MNILSPFVLLYSKFILQVAFLKDTISRKDEVIERLQQLKANVNGVKCGMNSQRYDSSSPRRYLNGTALHSPRLSGRKGSRLFEKASSDTDNCSEHSERRSEAGSSQSMDNFQHNKMLLPQSKSNDDLTLKKEFVSRPNFVGTCLSHKDKEDLDLLGFGDADSDERLSDISDGCLSRAETEGSLGSAVEFTLFPESKPSEVAKPAGKAENKRCVCFNFLINLNVLQSFFAALDSYFLVFSDTFFSFQFMSLL